MQRQALEHAVDLILSLAASAGVPRILIDAGTQKSIRRYRHGCGTDRNLGCS